MNVKLWKGRWVKFADTKNLFPTAFHTRDGRVVGIIQYGTGYKKNQDTGEMELVTMPPHIVVVDQNGENVMLEIPGSQPQTACISVFNVQFLEGIVSRDDIPPARLLLVPADWQPKG